MYNIIFKGHFETEKQDELIDKLQKILEETDTTYLGEIQSFKLPEYVDYQRIDEDEKDSTGENDSVQSGDTTVSDSDI